MAKVVNQHGAPSVSVQYPYNSTTKRPIALSNVGFRYIGVCSMQNIENMGKRRDVSGNDR